MALHRWISRYLLLFLVLSFVPSLLSAQSNEMPKGQIFGGYSWLHPGGKIGNTTPPDIENAWGTQFIFNINRWAGLAFDASGHYDDFGKLHTFTGGPQLRWHTKNFTPFAEALFGTAKIEPDGLANENNFAVLAGGGLDLNLSRRIWLRLIQADYQHTSYNGDAMNGVRLQTGLVVNLGLPKEEMAPVSAECSLMPSQVDPGVPVHMQVTPSGFSPERKLSYSYLSSGGRLTADGPMVNVDTAGLAGGTYTVQATVTDDGKGKHQRRASCQASFTVNAQHPPTLTVTANPNSLFAGEPSEITAVGSSPDNRPLMYNCGSAAGSVYGIGQHYTLETGQAPTGTITVTCSVVDDRGLSAVASAPIQVKALEAPAQGPVVEELPPAPEPYLFGAIEFKHDRRRPTRVDNEAKGELDRYADALAAAPDSVGVVVGHATVAEERGKGSNYAAQRAVNTKDYLVKEKEIDPSRIEPRVGSGNDKRVDLWIVPAGSVFPEADTVPVDENNVRAVPRNRRR
jgi:hypothetical protein